MKIYYPHRKNVSTGTIEDVFVLVDNMIEEALRDYLKKHEPHTKK
jgi:hypothetical protein